MGLRCRVATNVDSKVGWLEWREAIKLSRMSRNTAQDSAAISANIPCRSPCQWSTVVVKQDSE